MTNYKDTLNLPNTKFPMKANLAQREPAMLAHWQAIDLYHSQMQQRAGCEVFLLHDGPPYANGNIHIGHALNKILKDIIIKSKAMQGFKTPYVPGWDCHGLPIELNVEKKVGKPGVKIDAKAFREACRKYALTQVDIQRDAFKRLGVLGDWDNPYLTMDFNYEANIIRSLGKIIEQGHLQKGRKPVHWCINCGSALAEAEVEYSDKQSPSIDVRFRLLDPQALQKAFALDTSLASMPSIVIWTTTPWTLPANQAVAVHPELTYALVQCQSAQGSETIILADELVDACMQRYACTAFKVLARCPGAALEYLQAQHPFYQRSVPIVLGEHVTLDNGTGAVHTAPAHGREDFEVALHYQLPLDNPVGANGCYLDDVPLFAGVSVYKANDEVLNVLREQDALLQHNQLTHSYPHCWRHKTPLIFRATTQWFISMHKQGLVDKALASINDVSWIPSWGDVRLTRMLENRPDWCISRQRAWGTPLALFVHKKTGDMHPRMPALIEEIASRVAERGIQAWFDLDASELLGADAEEYEKLNDTLDVWYDSGVSHACVLAQRDELQLPADLYLEGSDQYRGWFQSSFLTSLAMTGKPPYKTVITHGFTLDGQGRKMSKSLGNTIEPEKIVKTLGADILRLWVATTDYQAEQSVSDQILQRTADMYRRLRNTARFLLANLHDFDPKQHSVAHDQLLALDQWAIARAHALQSQLLAAYDAYELHTVTQKIHHFCAVDMGGFYLDVIKDRQYTTQANSLARRSTQTAIYHILEGLVRWFAPILSFTADEIWQHMPGERDASVFLQTWYNELQDLSSTAPLSMAAWDELLVLRDEVNKALEAARDQGQIGSALDAQVDLYVDADWQARLQVFGEELHFLFICSAANVLSLPAAPKQASASEIAGVHIQVSAVSHEKCARCWHRMPDVGQHAEHPTLCSRCISNISGEGETRCIV